MLKLIDTWCEVYVNKFQLLSNTAGRLVSGREVYQNSGTMRAKCIQILIFENNSSITKI